MIYFEIVSTFALVIGAARSEIWRRPGAGFGEPRWPSAQAGATYAKQAEAQKECRFFLHIIPDTVVGAFAAGETSRFCCSQFFSALP